MLLTSGSTKFLSFPVLIYSSTLQIERGEFQVFLYERNMAFHAIFARIKQSAKSHSQSKTIESERPHHYSFRV